MQETRRQILDIIKDKNWVTVDDIVVELESLRGSITSVTVRHHLGKLQEDGLINATQSRHSASPGRPKHIYALTDLGRSHFPNNYPELASNLLKQIRSTLPPAQVNVIIEGVADSMANDADIPRSGSLRERLESVLDYLNTHGYEASMELHREGYVLITHNCPYHKISNAGDDHTLCDLDMRLISRMLGVIPRLLTRASDGDSQCSYLIPS